MNIRLLNVTTGEVIETFIDQANGKFTSAVVVNPGVGAYEFKVQVQCGANSGGGNVYGAAMVADQGKR